jgi:hypothetical protein
MIKIATAQDYAEGLVEHAKRLAVVATWEGRAKRVLEMQRSGRSLVAVLS